MEKLSSNNSLAEILDTIRKWESRDIDLPVFKIHILRNYTVEGLLPHLKLYFFQKGLRAQISLGDFDVIEQSLMEDLEVQRMNSADLVFMSLYFDKNASADQMDRGINILELAKKNVRVPVAVSSIIKSPYSEQGIASASLNQGFSIEADECNLKLKKFISQNNEKFLWIDFNQIMSRVGYKDSIDQRYWYMSAAPFKKAFHWELAAELAKIGLALKGKSKKVLALDCDNTLWGGIIGEDGIEGIRLDPNSYPGKAFHDFQRSVVRLQERGVMLVLCSKNNETDVMQVLKNHPHSLIKPKHLAAWQVNWQSKDENLKQLSKQLNVGLDCFVFVDDSPIECGLVSAQLPMVEVLQVPNNIFELPDLLLENALFDSLAVTKEDARRTAMYQQEALRKADASNFQNVEEYLASLNMTVTIHQIQKEEISRVAQLAQKTNQFNFTTERLSEAEVLLASESPDNMIFTMALEDKFGSSGLTGVIFVQKSKESLIVNNYLMSCRVLGRKIEFQFLQTALQQASRHWRLDAIEANYKPTAKNEQVSNFWDQVGLACVSRENPKVYRGHFSKMRFPKINFIDVKE